MPSCQKRAIRVDADAGVVRAAWRQRPIHGPRVADEIMDQIDDPVAEGNLELTPVLWDRVGNLEEQGPVSRQPSSIFDRTLCWVVTEALGDLPLIAQHPQESAAVAAHVQDAPAPQVRFDRLERRLPNELVRALHRFVLGRASPIPVALPRREAVLW